MTLGKYPTYEEIKDSLSQEDCIYLLDQYADEHGEDIVDEWIKENYDQEYYEDPDYLYDKMKDDRLTGDI